MNLCLFIWMKRFPRSVSLLQLACYFYRPEEMGVVCVRKWAWFLVIFLAFCLDETFVLQFYIEAGIALTI